MDVSLQLYEIFTFLGEMGGIVQVHAENGEIIAEVTHLSQQPPTPSSLLPSLTFDLYHSAAPYIVIHCTVPPD